MFSTPKAVVFDLGGVLARIAHTWPEAAQVANQQVQDAPEELDDIRSFSLYQAGLIDFDEYLRDLAAVLGCGIDAARAIHNGIIKEEYLGANELVRELEDRRVLTGCLSNTNEAHWEHLAMNGRFPTIARLQMKMASHLENLSKPDPEIYRLFCSRFQLRPADIVYFDDHPLNVRTANLEGWNSTLIDPRGNPIAQMRQVLSAMDLLP